jgi:hypothetical protein
LIKGNKKADSLISDEVETIFIPIRVLKFFKFINPLLDCFCKVNHEHALSGTSVTIAHCFGDDMSKDSNGTKKQAERN